MNQKTTQSISNENCATERGKMDVEQVHEELAVDAVRVEQVHVEQVHVEQVHEEHVLEELVAVDAAERALEQHVVEGDLHERRARLSGRTGRRPGR